MNVTTNYEELSCFIGWNATLDATLIITIIVTAITGNSLVLIAIFKVKTLRTGTNMFIGSLSFADILVALVPLPMSFVLYVCNWKQDVDDRTIFAIMDILSSTVSIVSLTAIACDRYFAICHPYVYKEVVTTASALVVCGFLWIFGTSAALLRLAIEIRTYTMFIIISAYVVPSLIMFACYTRIAIIAKSQAKRIRSLQIRKRSAYAMSKKRPVLHRHSTHSLEIQSRRLSRVASSVESFTSVLDPEEDTSVGMRDPDSTDYSPAAAIATFTVYPKIQAKPKLRKITDASIRTFSFNEHEHLAADSVKDDCQVQNEASCLNTMQDHVPAPQPSTSSGVSEITRHVSPKKVNSPTRNCLELPSRKDSKLVGDTASRKDSKLVGDTAARRKTLNAGTPILQQLTVTSCRSESDYPSQAGLKQEEGNLQYLQQQVMRQGQDRPDTSHFVSLNKDLPPAALDQPSKTFRSVVQNSILPRPTLQPRQSTLRKETARILRRVRNLRKEFKASLMLAVVMGSFLCMWTPFISINVRVYFCLECPVDRVLVKYFKLLHFMNSALNPVIYVLFNSTWRHAFEGILTNIRKKLMLRRRKTRVTPIPKRNTESINVASPLAGFR